MNLMRIISHTEPIGGLVITDTHVRIAETKHGKREKSAGLTLIEEPIPTGTIVHGIVREKGPLVVALKKALAQTTTPYFIVSIPPDAVYSKILTFPPLVSGDRLTEAITLALGFQLPFKASETYIDHQIIPATEANDVLLSACPKAIIDAYSVVLQSAGIKAVALEPHTMSIAREYENKEPSLLTIPYSESTVVAIIDQHLMRFSRSLPKEQYAETALTEEVARIKDFYATEYGVNPVQVEWKDVACTEQHCTLLPPSVSSQDWLPALGALARAEIPRKSDTLVSLLPIGTEEAYAFQKASAFANFMRNLTIGVAVFFFVAYVGVLALMIPLKNRYAETLSTPAVSPASAHVLEEEVRAREFNELLSTTAALVAENPRWSGFIESFKSSVGSGITITSMTIDTPERPIPITGSAKTRAELNAFRDTLLARGDIIDVELPLTNLELRADIPFTISFTLQDPTTLFSR